jgi:hypothetical protein
MPALPPTAAPLPDPPSPPPEPLLLAEQATPIVKQSAKQDLTAACVHRAAIEREHRTRGMLEQGVHARAIKQHRAARYEDKWIPARSRSVAASIAVLPTITIVGGSRARAARSEQHRGAAQRRGDSSIALAPCCSTFTIKLRDSWPPNLR